MKILKTLLLICFFTLSFRSDIVLADKENFINNSGMISDLPYGLKFFVDINEEIEISDIAIKFKVLDRSALQYDYFDLDDYENNNFL